MSIEIIAVNENGQHLFKGLSSDAKGTGSLTLADGSEVSYEIDSQFTETDGVGSKSEFRGAVGWVIVSANGAKHNKIMEGANKESESAAIAQSITGYRLSNGYPAAAQDVIMGAAQSGAVTLLDGADTIAAVTPGAGLAMDLKGRKASSELIVTTALSAACSVAWSRLDSTSIIPTTFLIDGYGDSFMDAGAATGYIGESLGLHTSQDAVFTEYAVAGENLEDIKTAFLGNYKSNRTNRIVIQGSINNVLAAGKISSLATMIKDASAVMDLALAKSDEPVAFVGLAPFNGKTGVTAAQLQQALDFNSAMQAKYPDNYVDAYDLLGDTADPTQLADWAYKSSRAADLHPNKDADRVLDRAIADVIFPAQTPYDTTEPTGNILGDYRDMTAWTYNANAQNGGHTITLADGDLDAGTKGLLPDANDGVSSKEAQKNSTSIPAISDNMQFVGLFAPGDADYVWVRVSDSAATSKTFQYFVNLVTLTASVNGGTGTGATIEVTKAAYGFVEVKIKYVNTGAAKVTNVTYRSSADGVSTTTNPWDRDGTGDQYPTEISADCLSLVIL